MAAIDVVLVPKRASYIKVMMLHLIHTVYVFLSVMALGKYQLVITFLGYIVKDKWSKTCLKKCEKKIFTKISLKFSYQSNQSLNLKMGHLHQPKYYSNQEPKSSSFIPYDQTHTPPPHSKSIVSCPSLPL